MCVVVCVCVYVCVCVCTPQPPCGVFRISYLAHPAAVTKTQWEEEMIRRDGEDERQSELIFFICSLGRGKELGYGGSLMTSVKAARSTHLVCAFLLRTNRRGLRLFNEIVGVRVRKCSEQFLVLCKKYITLHQFVWLLIFVILFYKTKHHSARAHTRMMASSSSESPPRPSSSRVNGGTGRALFSAKVFRQMEVEVFSKAAHV